MRFTTLALVSLLVACGGAPAEPSAPSPAGPPPGGPPLSTPPETPPDPVAPSDTSPDGIVMKGKDGKRVVVPQTKPTAPPCGSGCPAGTRCLYHGNDGYCVTPCSQSGARCANGGTCSQGSSCPVCADAPLGCF
jgi:hypothetical protein